MKRTSYRQLQADERLTIASMKQRGLRLREIARTLRREPNTVSRELRRNGAATGYASAPAQAASGARREAARPMAKLHPQGRRPGCATVMTMARLLILCK